MKHRSIESRGGMHLNLEDFYRGRDEDYPVILERFMGNENLLKKVREKFPRGSYLWTVERGSRKLEFFKTI